VEANTTASGKYQALLTELRRIGIGPRSTERVVVFAERIATLTWLAEHLREDLSLPADAVRVMHGSLSDVEQQEIVEQFRQAHTPVRVLVTGDVASEGVNLHAQCHELIHYDIPWSLIRIEQRNGRIDRYGQSVSPQITTLLLSPSDPRFSGDVRVLTRLMEKEDQAHRALGDAASLMGLYSGEKEEEAIRQAGTSTSSSPAWRGRWGCRCVGRPRRCARPGRALGSTDSSRFPPTGSWSCCGRQRRRPGSGCPPCDEVWMRTRPPSSPQQRPVATRAGS